MVKWKDKTRSNSRKIYGPSFTVEGSQLFPIKIAGPAGNDVKFNLKIDSEAKIDAESDGAHHSLKKRCPKGPGGHFGHLRVWPQEKVQAQHSTI